MEKDELVDAKYIANRTNQHVRNIYAGIKAKRIIYPSVVRDTKNQREGIYFWNKSDADSFILKYNSRKRKRDENKLVGVKYIASKINRHRNTISRYLRDGIIQCYMYDKSGRPLFVKKDIDEQIEKLFVRKTYINKQTKKIIKGIVTQKELLEIKLLNDSLNYVKHLHEKLNKSSIKHKLNVIAEIAMYFEEKGERYGGTRGEIGGSSECIGHDGRGTDSGI